MGLKTGRWLKKRQVPVDRTLGKELTLLAWAIEDADPSLILLLFVIGWDLPLKKDGGSTP